MAILAQDFQVCTLVRSGDLVEVGLDVAQGFQTLPVDKFPLDWEVEETTDFSEAISNRNEWIFDLKLVLRILPSVLLPSNL